MEVAAADAGDLKRGVRRVCFCRKTQRNFLVFRGKRRDRDGLLVAGALAPYKRDRNLAAGCSLEPYAAGVSLALYQCETCLLDSARSGSIKLNFRAVVAD